MTDHSPKMPARVVVHDIFKFIGHGEEDVVLIIKGACFLVNAVLNVQLTRPLSLLPFLHQFPALGLILIMGALVSRGFGDAADHAEERDANEHQAKQGKNAGRADS